MKATAREYKDKRGKTRLSITIDVSLEQVKHRGVDHCASWAETDIGRRLAVWCRVKGVTPVE